MKHFEFRLNKGRKGKKDRVLVLKCKHCQIEEWLWIRAVLQIVRELKLNEERINPQGSYQFIQALNQAIYTNRPIDEILAPFSMKKVKLI